MVWFHGGGQPDGSACDAVPFPGVPGVLPRPGPRPGAGRRRGHHQLPARTCSGSSLTPRSPPRIHVPTPETRACSTSGPRSSGCAPTSRVRRQSEEGDDLRRVGRLAGRVLARRLAGQPPAVSSRQSARAADARRASRRRPRAPQQRGRSPPPSAAAARPTSSAACASPGEYLLAQSAHGLGSAPSSTAGSFPISRGRCSTRHYAQGAVPPRLQQRRGHALLPRRPAGDDRGRVPGRAPGALRNPGAQVAAVYPASDSRRRRMPSSARSATSILVCSTYDTARRAAAGGAHTYSTTSHAIPIPTPQPAGLHAFHGSEIVYVFGSITPPTPDDGTLGAPMRDLLDPVRAQRQSQRPRRILTWPRYTHPGDQRINLDVDPGVLTGSAAASASSGGASMTPSSRAARRAGRSSSDRSGTPVTFAQEPRLLASVPRDHGLQSRSTGGKGLAMSRRLVLMISVASLLLRCGSVATAFNYGGGGSSGGGSPTAAPAPRSLSCRDAPRVDDLRRGSARPASHQRMGPGRGTGHAVVDVEQRDQHVHALLRDGLRHLAGRSVPGAPTGSCSTAARSSCCTPASARPRPRSCSRPRAA